METKKKFPKFILPLLLLLAVAVLVLAYGHKLPAAVRKLIAKLPGAGGSTNTTPAAS